MADVSDHRFYYLRNFESALRWLSERYDDLMDGAERTFIECFGQLPRDSRAVLVRLIMRRGPLFRQFSRWPDRSRC